MSSILLGSTNVYGDGIDIISDGLQFYLDSTNTDSYSGSGTAWNDLSGNGNNFSWASTPSFTSGSPSYFTTSNICNGPASNSFGITNTSGYTIHVICRVNSYTQAYSFQFHSNTASYNRGIFAHITWSNQYVYFDQGGCCSSSQRVNVASGGALNWNIWTFRRLTNSSTRSIWKNGTNLINNTASAVSPALSSSAVRIGNISNWNARLGGFICYNRGLSDAEIVDNYNTLRTRYGI